MKNKISLRSVETLLKKAGAKRSSESAKKQLREIIEKHTETLSVKAISFSQHAKP